MNCFKAYDIRGVWGKDLNEETVYRIGYFLPDIVGFNNILVGQDIRLSSDTVMYNLAKGLNDRGVSVDFVGLSTTPLIYWTTAKMGYHASVMITASHNPSNHNGLKISGLNATPIGYDSGLDKLENLVESDKITTIAEKRGIINKIDIYEQYINFLSQYKVDISNLKIAVDCSNGMSSLFIKQLLGDTPVYINDKPDGRFPGHEPNPLEAENRKQLTGTVVSHACDIGLLFDGDADRITFIDEKGNLVSPDLIIALLGHYFLEEKKQKGIVLQDIRSSRAVQEYLKRFNAEVVTWKVGRAYAALKLRELDGCYGGELAGHYYFRDFYYSDSGIMAALIVLRILLRFKEKGMTMSELTSNISDYFNTGEINFKIENKKDAMEDVKNYFFAKKQPVKFYDFDGYRLDYENFWFSIRPSNTEPYLRFIAEAKSQNLLDDILNNVKAIIEHYE